MMSSNGFTDISDRSDMNTPMHDRDSSNNDKSLENTSKSNGTKESASSSSFTSSSTGDSEFETSSSLNNSSDVKPILKEIQNSIPQLSGIGSIDYPMVSTSTGAGTGQMGNPLAQSTPFVAAAVSSLFQDQFNSSFGAIMPYGMASATHGFPAGVFNSGNNQMPSNDRFNYSATTAGLSMANMMGSMGTTSCSGHQTQQFAAMAAAQNSVNNNSSFLNPNVISNANNMAIDLYRGLSNVPGSSSFQTPPSSRHNFQQNFLLSNMSNNGASLVDFGGSFSGSSSLFDSGVGSGGLRANHLPQEPIRHCNNNQSIRPHLLQQQIAGNNNSPADAADVGRGLVAVGRKRKKKLTTMTTTSDESNSSGGSNDDSENKGVVEKRLTFKPYIQQANIDGTKGFYNLEEFTDVFPEVSARLALLGQSKKYKVSLAEIHRRISTPEVLNASLLNAILRKAKNKDGGKNLRQILYRYSLVMPPGRRASITPKTFTSLCEGEAIQMADDFCFLSEKYFPAEELALSLVGLLQTGSTTKGELQLRLVEFQSARNVIFQAMTILEKGIENETLPINQTFELEAAGPSSALQQIDSEAQNGVTKFARHTHCFGNRAVLTAWKTLESVFEKCTQELSKRINSESRTVASAPSSSVQR